MDAIVLAAGRGVRMQLGYPKQFLKINGKPCFIYVLEVLNNCPAIGTIYMTCHADYMEEYARYAEMYHIRNAVMIAGGATRQDSVRLALEHVTSERVLIHEAARPLISVDFVDEILACVGEEAVVPTIPISFTVAQGGEYMECELDRSKLHNIQLPQVFDTHCLRQVHERALQDGYRATEDGMLAFHYGVRVRFVRGRESNIKVTTPLDVKMVEKLLKL